MSARSSHPSSIVGNGARFREIASISPAGRGAFHWYSSLAIMAVLCLSYLDVPDYLYTLNGVTLPKYFFYAFVAVLTPSLILSSRSLGAYVTSPFVLWGLALIALNLANLGDAVINRDEFRAGLVGTRIQYVLLVLVLGFACSTAPRASFERIFPFLAVMIAASVILDFLVPGVLYPLDTEGATPGRAAATFINANKAGESMLITFLLALPALRPRYRTALFLLVGAAVIVTFSRAAILGWLLLWIYLLVTRGVPRYTLAFPLLAALLSLSLGGFENYLSERKDLAEGLANIEARVAFFRDGVLDDESAFDRADALQHGMEVFRQNPIFGAGAGATLLWSGSGTHNLVVMLAAEYGLMGVGMWLWLVVLLWRGHHFQDRRFQVAMAAFFVFVSMFTHNPFDSLYWLLTFALVAVRRRS